MTHDEFVARSCSSKAQYVGRREARDNAQKLMHKHGGGRVVAYRCRVASDHWHVGHAVSKRNRRRAA